LGLLNTEKERVKIKNRRYKFNKDLKTNYSKFVAHCKRHEIDCPANNHWVLTSEDEDTSFTDTVLTDTEISIIPDKMKTEVKMITTGSGEEFGKYKYVASIQHLSNSKISKFIIKSSKLQCEFHS
jgi:hypothetical protein